MPAESDTDDMDTLKRWYDQQLASERTRADALESKLRDYIKATKLDGGSDYLKIAISERDKVIAQLVHEFVDRMAELSLSGESDRSTTQLQKDIGDNVSSDVDVVLIENPHLKVLRSLLERLCGNMNKAYLSEGRKEAPEVLELSVARIRTPLDGSQELYPCAVEPVNRFGPHSSEQLYPQKLVETSDKSVETSTTDPVVTRNQQQPDSESCSSHS